MIESRRRCDLCKKTSDILKFENVLLDEIHVCQLCLEDGKLKRLVELIQSNNYRRCSGHNLQAYYNQQLQQCKGLTR